MADLSAVLRKTIDGLPNATPELRAKVYDKARAAIARQIENADPPLAGDVASMRRAALEDAIGATEAHYTQAPNGQDAAASAAPRAAPARPPFVAERRTPVAPPPPIEPPAMPRVQADFVSPPPPPRVEAREPARPPAVARSEAGVRRREEPTLGSYAGAPSVEPESGLDIPDADTSAPRYSAPRTRRGGSRRPLLLGTAAAVVVAALGAGAYLYRSELGALLGSSETQTATSSPSAASPSVGDGASESSDAATPATPPGSPTPPPAEARRQFTQRLQPDGTETDDGPAPTNANAFDEGTNIAAATPEATPAPDTPADPAVPNTASPPPAAAATAPPPAAPSPAPNSAAPAVAQRAIFYEERTADLQGTQQTGNVVWSIVNEPPAEGQPPEPAIRAEATIPNANMRMAMTIRRNLDATLPASHVIELQFDVPPGFAGGQVANVQRLALKPSEEARGEPLIGVAGKISDGFFIIALNNLDRATETNLGLLGRQEWIDVPIAYATGRRALISIEKGVPGERVFKEALDAWAART